MTKRVLLDFEPDPQPVRQPSQRITEPWPFLLSYVKGRGLVRNVTVPAPVKRAKLLK